MSRVPLISVDEMNEQQHQQYDRFPSNLTRGLLLLEERLAGALPNTANALRASSFPPRLREAVILRVAALHESAYERMQHLDQARKAGWSDEEIDEIEKGSTAVSDTHIRDLLRFVEACVAHAIVPDDIFDAIREVCSPREIATVIVLVGHYMTVARFLGILQIPLDSKPDSWQQEH